MSQHLSGSVLVLRRVELECLHQKSMDSTVHLPAGVSTLAASVAPPVDSPSFGFLSFFLKTALNFAFRLVSAFGAVQNAEVSMRSWYKVLNGANERGPAIW